MFEREVIEAEIDLKRLATDLIIAVDKLTEIRDRMVAAERNLLRWRDAKATGVHPYA